MSEIMLRPEITRLVPASIVNNVSSFVFYDNHPRDQKLIDIVICSNSGEIQEFYQRDLICSLLLDNTSGPYSIKMMRNPEADLFYLVQTREDFFILSRKETIKVVKRISNVEKYEIDDTKCTGRIQLKVYYKDDAIPLVFNDTLAIIEEITTMVEEDESPMLVVELQSKLSEAKYNLECNENTYRELVNLRQMASYSIYQKNQGISDNPQPKCVKEMSEFKLKLKSPWVKYCNKKVVIAIDTSNHYHEDVEELHLLLNNNCSSLTYTTKLFKKYHKPPYWIEKKKNMMEPNSKITIVVIIEFDELFNTSFSKVELDGVVAFKKNGKEYLVPFDHVVISSMDAMGENFDVLPSDFTDQHSVLAAITSTVKTDLILRLIKAEIRQDFLKSLKAILCDYLQMETIPKMDNVLIHKRSPYHKLNGIIIVFNDKYTLEEVRFDVTVYSRTPSQVLALIRYIYDAVPFKILITTADQKVTAKLDEFSSYNDTLESPSTVNNIEYASSILDRTSLVLEYLDCSMIKMNESKDPTVRDKIGKVIDLLACGQTDYNKFRAKMSELGAKGVIKMLGDDDNSDNEIEVNSV
ncbi:uncharacterized protein LOC114242675 [Bombyx mandarina]|uniref:Uncharacterized protein LOC114242675 n=1 Tax=Bombyx mandarina TaxID=7092 RepID=A0A6J2JL28_BOMMA|nr:uncharacterized protein LOC114242675 [Bombyx mandarina]